ncbi:MAG TPA: methyltransferase domain-containing protein [Terriglobales bacterium]|nr:methyltransferase domain-containing protein [Terriglobales bacterium]
MRVLEETFEPMPQQLPAATQDGLSASEAIAKTAPHIGLEQYYSEAGPDYAAWSREFNMHFGYYRAGANPLNREAMLEQMNAEVLARLELDGVTEPRLLDLGCGLGATLRSFARRLPHSKLLGVTRVPWQVEQGRALNAAAGCGDRICVFQADYEHTPLSSCSYDGIYALESSCYAQGSDKRMLLQEAHRLLRSGGRLVVVDGFRGRRFVSKAQQHIYRKVCECWVVEDFAELQPFLRRLGKLGFREITVEHLQMRVAPSVMHVPWVSLKFLLTDVVFGARAMTRARWNNVLAPLLLPLVSAPLGPLTYCMITATKT